MVSEETKAYDEAQIKKWEGRILKVVGAYKKGKESVVKGKKAVTKELDKAAREMPDIKIPKTPKSYKKLRKGVERLFAQPKKRKVSLTEIKRRRAFELKKLKLLHKQRMDYLAAQAEATAQSQDLRFQTNHAEDQFLAEAQPEAPPREEEYYGQNYQAPSQSSNMKRRIINGFGNIGRGLSRIGQRRPQVDKYGRPVQNIQNLPKEVQQELNRRGTILNMPNTFNKPSGVTRHARLNLMDSERSKPQAKKLSFWRAE